MEGELDKGLEWTRGCGWRRGPHLGDGGVARWSVGTSSKEMVGQGWGGVENCRRLASGSSVINSNN